jgi:hypothetical protein
MWCAIAQRMTCHSNRYDTLLPARASLRKYLPTDPLDGAGFSFQKDNAISRLKIFDTLFAAIRKD